MSVETVELPELVAIGFEVVAPWQDLPQAVPAAWRRLFERDTGASAFLEISISRQDGIYRELVGFLAASRTKVPEGMTRLVIPAQRYLRIMHEGPLEGITAGFQQLYAYAAAHGLEATDFKLDFGYQHGLPPGRHELHVALAPERLRLA
ncbi:MAG TPA: GyrI-like domain-containing protein [Devosiaceae bacterium]|jgi:predicted transcriptional regulator YdeE|nr:GyrI-like domain-containing protein [Devosiaceae bacterium]